MKTGVIKTLPDTGYLRLPEVLALFPVGKSTWWEGIKKGWFPAGVKLSKRTTAWRVEDIRKLIESPANFPDNSPDDKN